MLLPSLRQDLFSPLWSACARLGFAPNAEIGPSFYQAYYLVQEQLCTCLTLSLIHILLGLVCDPVGGLVEYPCQNRNAAGVANALIAAELSLKMCIRDRS